MSTSPAPSAAPKGLRMPHTLVIVGALILLVLILSWLVPSGEFQRIEKLLPDGGRGYLSKVFNDEFGIEREDVIEMDVGNNRQR